jgi:hypothetical protein
MGIASPSGPREDGVDLATGRCQEPEAFMSRTRDDHADGSYTVRDDVWESSVTYNSDGSVRESVTVESALPFDVLHLGPEIQVTRDSDGNVTDVKHHK